MARVRWSMDALHDLEEQLEHIHAHNPHASAHVAERIIRAEMLLQDFPLSGRYDAQLGVREFWAPGTRLKLVYVTDGDDLEIIAVFHTSRDPADKGSKRA